MKISIHAILIGLLIAITAPIQSNAQSSSDDEFLKKGIKAGWHYAGMYRSGTQKYGNLNSFYVGLYSEGLVTENFAVGSGINYFQNGFTQGDKNFKMHIVSLNSYFKPIIGPIFIKGGFALNFKLGDNREDFPGQILDTKFFDIPLTAGAGIELGMFVIEANYSWGLFDAASLEGAYHKSRYLQAGFALTF